MRIDSQLHILTRLSALNGNPGEYKMHHAAPYGDTKCKVDYENVHGQRTGYDNIQAAIHHEINKLIRKEELAKELYAGKQALLAKRVHRNGSRAQRLADEKRAPRK